MKPLLKSSVAAMLAMGISAAYADTAIDEKIAQLQKMLEAQQQQMKAMSDELNALKTSSAATNSTSSAATESDWKLQAMQDEIQGLEQRPTVTAGDKEGIGFKSSNGDFSIKLHGLFQGDFRSNEAGGATNTGWIIRKARPWIEGSLFGWIDYKLTPEFATTTSNVATSSNGTSISGNATLGTPEVIDAYADFKFAPWFKVRAGKFKPFVGLARLQSDTVGKFLEQSMVTANLLPQRDVGISAFGDLFEGKLNYAVGFSNGVIDGGDQSVALDTNNDKEFTARVFAEPFKGSDSILSGLGVGIAATENNQRGSTTSSQLPSYRSFSQINFFSYNTGAFANGRRYRWSPQAYYYHGPFGLMAEYAHESQAVTLASNSKTLGHDAWEITTSYLFTGEKASYGDVKPNQSFKPGSDGWGAWEVVARYNELNLDDNTFIGSNALANIATSAKSAKGVGIGLNWYLNNYSRFSIDYERTSFDGGKAGSTVTNLIDKPTENTLIGRMQVAF